MHIETLKIFCDLIETKSFSKTAKLNYLTQSAVSQQIKQLEQHFDKRLVERGVRTLTPTPVGEMFYKGAKEVLDKYYQLERTITMDSEALTGTVKVSVVYSIGLHEMPVFMKRFLREHPNIQVQMEYARTTRVYDDVCANMADIGIVAIARPRRILDIQTLFADKLVIICHPDHSLAKKKTVKAMDLNNVPIVAFEKNIPTRKMIDRELRLKGASPVIAMEFDNVETIKEAVEVNQGVGIVPKAAVVRELENKLLTMVEISDVEMLRPVCMIYRKDKMFIPAVQRFIEELKKMTANLTEEERQIGLHPFTGNCADMEEIVD